jgi:hypothetical protein
VTHPPGYAPPPDDADGYDERVWRRPFDAPVADPPATPTGRTAPDAPTTPTDPPEYAGPPRTTPAAPGWRPPTMIQVPRARTLPAQDGDAIDTTEAEALTITYGVGMVAGALALILLLVICGRLIF